MYQTTKRTTTTTEMKRARSLQLAQEANYAATSLRCEDVYLDNAGHLIAIALVAPSRHHADETHTVTYNAVNDTASCDCTAATYGNACCHAGAAIDYGRIARDCYTPAATRATRREQSINA